MALMQMDGAHVISRMAGQDLTGKLFYFVNLTGAAGAETVVLATAAATVAGVLMEENTVTVSPYSPVSVQHSGISKVKAGGSIASNAEVEVGSGGTAVTLSAGRAVGKALQAASTNDIIEVKLY